MSTPPTGLSEDNARRFLNNYQEIARHSFENMEEISRRMHSGFNQIPSNIPSNNQKLPASLPTSDFTSTSYSSSICSDFTNMSSMPSTLMSQLTNISTSSGGASTDTGISSHAIGMNGGLTVYSVAGFSPKKNPNDTAKVTRSTFVPAW